MSPARRKQVIIGLRRQLVFWVHSSCLEDVAGPPALISLQLQLPISPCSPSLPLLFAVE